MLCFASAQDRTNPRRIKGYFNANGSRGREAIEAAGASLLYLPPYSPDFNPIELAFAKLKAFLRAVRPRTFDQVCDLIRTALALFLPSECTNYVQHCGYRVLHRS